MFLCLNTSRGPSFLIPTLKRPEASFLPPLAQSSVWGSWHFSDPALCVQIHETFLALLFLPTSLPKAPSKIFFSLQFQIRCFSDFQYSKKMFSPMLPQQPAQSDVGLIISANSLCSWEPARTDPLKVLLKIKQPNMD